MNGPHEIVTAPSLTEPVGYAHAVVASPGRTVFLGGQTSLDQNGTVVGTTVIEQFDVAAGNVVAALAAAGCEPAHLVSLTIYVTDVAAYRSSLAELGEVYLRHFGRHYVASALFGVHELFDAAALVELVATAVLPDRKVGSE